jgi:hypothetical protein
LSFRHVSLPCLCWLCMPSEHHSGSVICSDSRPSRSKSSSTATISF